MDVVKISKALADPLRWEILKRIASAIQSPWAERSPGVCVCHVVDEMSLLQSKVSYHIEL
jgi:DNA-binding transcriptional ArsR family regulator